MNPLSWALPSWAGCQRPESGLNPPRTRVTVPGIVVRFRLAGVYGPGRDTAAVFLTLDGRTASRPDSLVAIDTTDASGLASRTLVAAGKGVDSVIVIVRARSLKNVPLKGDSLRFVLRTSP